MQQVTYIAPGQVEQRDVPPARLRGDGEAIVRPVAVATCDLDLGIVRGATPWGGPLPLGHEGVGQVIEAGEDVERVAVGDLACLPYQVSCGACRRCRAGLTAHCEGHGGRFPGPQVYGWGPSAQEWGGFLADRIRVPFADHMLLPLPPGVAPEAVASLSDNVVDGWRCVAGPLADVPGAAVLVVGGSGSIGLYAVQAALALGAAVVEYVDRSSRRCAAAEALGAVATRLEPGSSPPLGPFPITVDANSTADGLLLALRSTDSGGVCTSAGMHFRDVELPLLELYMRNVTLRVGIIQARPGMDAVMALIQDGRLRPERVTDRVLAWDDAAAALPDVREKLVFRRDPIADRR